MAEWEDFGSIAGGCPDHRAGDRNKLRSISNWKFFTYASWDQTIMDDESIRLPIEDVLDLHSFAPADIESVVEEYLLEARKSFRSVRLIHGKGIGFQRSQVRALLARLEFVERFANAPPEAGGWGATIVWLR
jgi:hypothetical protein